MRARLLRSKVFLSATLGIAWVSQACANCDRPSDHATDEGKVDSAPKMLYYDGEGGTKKGVALQRKHMPVVRIFEDAGRSPTP
jgi:hypothetical protein